MQTTRLLAYALMQWTEVPWGGWNHFRAAANAVALRSYTPTTLAEQLSMSSLAPINHRAFLLLFISKHRCCCR